MCLCSFMAAEYDDLPDAVKAEVQTFADVNVAWHARMLTAASVRLLAKEVESAEAKCQRLPVGRPDLDPRGFAQAVIDAGRL